MAKARKARAGGRRRPPRLGDLVLVEWDDAYGESGWFDAETFRPNDTGCLTIGWLLWLDEEYVAACDTISAQGPGKDSAAGLSVIPKRWVRSWQVVQGVDNRYTKHLGRLLESAAAKMARGQIRPRGRGRWRTMADE